MYVMKLGEHPTGECYLELPEEEGEDGWIYIQFYNGSRIRFMQIKEPIMEPEEGSVEYRFRELEEHKFYLLQYIEKFIEDLCKATGVEFKTFEEWMPEAEPFPEREEEREPSAEYFMTTYDTYHAKRGW